MQNSCVKVLPSIIHQPSEDILKVLILVDTVHSTDIRCCMAYNGGSVPNLFFFQKINKTSFLQYDVIVDSLILYYKIAQLTTHQGITLGTQWQLTRFSQAVLNRTVCVNYRIA